MGNSDLYSHHDFAILTLYPLDFEEFLWANAEFALAREIRAHFTSFTPMGKDLHQKALSQFHLYQIIGGMPAAIMEYKKEKKVSGFGLGLNYVYKVITAMGGNVTVESIEGKYSEFTLTLPVQNENV